MYVRRLGQVPSIVQPADPTPLNDAVLYPQSGKQPRTRYRTVNRWPSVQPPVYASFPQQTTQIQTLPIPGQSIVGYDANGSPIYSGTQPASVTATVSANPGSLSAWLQTGNNGIYAALAVGVLLLLLTRRR
jgi:hypothetical protein